MFRSVSLIPSVAVVSQVSHYKQALASKIGWYNSCNSSAHITLNTFISERLQPLAWLKRLQHFCSVRTPFVIRFDSIKVFRESGTLYIGPDKQSAEMLKYLMSDFHTYTKDLKANRVNEPHMTIARTLKPKQVDIALEHFQHHHLNIAFDCDAIYVRRFNEARGQYDTESRHFFDGHYLPSVHHPQPLYLF